MNDNNIPDTEEMTTQTVGTLLREARESKGLKQDEIASQLRLSKDVIDNIEHDRHERLPAPIFVRGYIKSYAALVDVDPDYVSKLYREIAHTDEREISLTVARSTSVAGKSSLTTDSRNYAVPVMAALLIVLGVVLWMARDQQLEEMPVESVTATNELSEAGPGSTVVAVTPQPERPSTDTGTGEETYQSELLAQQQSPSDDQALSPGEAEAMPPAAAQTDEEEAGVADGPTAQPRLDRLIFIFDGDSWVDVMDVNGQRLIYRMVKSGERLQVSGTPPFKITLGNAPQSTLLRNDVEVDLGPYTRGNVAKFSLGRIDE